MLMNHYLLLGLSTDADRKQIKVAYRRMAKRFHPDTNRGSEAAAELFRQLNEAYRILTDSGLRTAYDAKLAAAENAAQQRRRAEQAAQQKAAQKSQSSDDPQQKFNRFLHSLLDALFEPTEDTSPKTAVSEPAAPAKNSVPLRQQPDFNFYYYLAMEKKSPPYVKGGDGVYRRTKSTRAQRVNHPASGFSRFPGDSLLILLCSSLWCLIIQ